MQALSPSDAGGLSPQVFREREETTYEALPIKASCFFCGWSYEGAVVEARAAAFEHRREVHPETIKRRKKMQHHLGSFRQVKLTDEDRALIELERSKRMKLLGLSAIE